MKRVFILLAALSWALYLGVSAWGATRINGNQLLEGTGEFGYSVSASRDGQVSSAPRLIYSVGQGVMARGTLPDSAQGVAFTVGYGLAYDIAHYLVCPVEATGDLSGDGYLSASDLVRLVQFIYKSAPSPEPCPAIGDVNCSGNVTAADAVVMINHIFRGDEGPCNVCSMIPDAWPCY
jgi:hypothetical protein